MGYKQPAVRHNARWKPLAEASHLFKIRSGPCCASTAAAKAAAAMAARAIVQENSKSTKKKKEGEKKMRGNFYSKS
jgi:hypothetical protein